MMLWVNMGNGRRRRRRRKGRRGGGRGGEKEAVPSLRDECASNESRPRCIRHLHQPMLLSFSLSRSLSLFLSLFIRSLSLLLLLLLLILLLLGLVLGADAVSPPLIPCVGIIAINIIYCDSVFVSMLVLVIARY